ARIYGRDLGDYSDRLLRLRLSVLGGDPALVAGRVLDLPPERAIHVGVGPKNAEASIVRPGAEPIVEVRCAPKKCALAARVGDPHELSLRGARWLCCLVARCRLTRGRRLLALASA